MRLVKTQPPQTSLVITKGHYINSKGRMTHHARGARNTHGPMSFTGIDGEGMMVNGEHRYVLFGIGEDQIEDPGGLYWKDVFEFLYSKHIPGNAYVGFFLGYDFTQILKSLPEEKAWILLSAKGRELRKRKVKNVKGMAPHPVEYDGWQFDMLTMKRLRIRPKLCDCPFPTCKCSHAPWMYACDVGGFFQTSFLKVINPKDWNEGTQVVTDEEYALIQAGKEKRSTAVLDDEMRMYNRLENVVLGRVMGTLDNGFRNIDIHLSSSKWFGPGQAAQAWLKKENVASREMIEDTVTPWFSEAARMSYFGGWFEIYMHGIIPGITHEYDINSAYPSVIAQLPCLLHGTYSRGEGMPPNDDGLTLVYARVVSPESQFSAQLIGSMLHRRKGDISRPMETEGWFWWDELQAAQRAGLIKRFTNKGRQKVKQWVKYTPCDCPPPMAGIAGLYDKRLEVGKTSPLGKAAKLVYNSGYGKFAQSVGEPIFGNAVYASRITAGCRTMILDAIATHPNGKAAVAMVATDAVYFLDEHPTLSISKKLGEWDHVEQTNLTLFKPGVYWDDTARDRITKGESPHFKARGFKASDFAEQIGQVDKVFSSWDELPDSMFKWAERVSLDWIMPGAVGKPDPRFNWPKVTFTPSFSMTTAVQALQRNKWETAGIVAPLDIELTQDSDPYKKRNGLYRDTYNGRTIYRSRPRKDDGEPSEPYAKRFGREDPWSDESKAESGETPEGRLIDILAWILNDN